MQHIIDKELVSRIYEELIYIRREGEGWRESSRKMGKRTTKQFIKRNLKDS